MWLILAHQYNVAAVKCRMQHGQYINKLTAALLFDCGIFSLDGNSAYFLSVNAYSGMLQKM